MRKSAFAPAARRLVLLASAVTLAGCASSPAVPRDVYSGGVYTREQAAALLDSIQRIANAGDGPRVSLSTMHEVGYGNRISARIRPEDDAYVAVVNVAPGGYAEIVFPEDPRDSGFLRGGRSYLIPSFFAGWPAGAVPPVGAHGSSFVWYGSSHFARVSTRGPGYLFVLASWTPINFDTLEIEGYFDQRDLDTDIDEQEPQHVIAEFAKLALGAGFNDVATADIARYSGYDFAAGARSLAYMSSSRCSGYDAFGLGMGLPSYYGFGYGYGPAGRSAWDRCNDNPAMYLAWLRARQPGFRPPPPPPDSTAGDSGSVTPPVRPVPPRGTGRWPPWRNEAVPATRAATDEVRLTREERQAARRRGDLEPRGRSDLYGDARPGRGNIGGRPRVGGGEVPRGSSAGSRPPQAGTASAASRPPSVERSGTGTSGSVGSTSSTRTETSASKPASGGSSSSSGSVDRSRRGPDGQR